MAMRGRAWRPKLADDLWLYFGILGYNINAIDIQEYIKTLLMQNHLCISISLRTNYFPFEFEKVWNDFSIQQGLTAQRNNTPSTR